MSAALKSGFDWSKVDWSKSNREIADALGCTSQSVYKHRKNGQHPPQKIDPDYHYNHPASLVEPIDYPRLAKVFRAEGWRWDACGYPSAEILQREIVRHKIDFERRVAECNSIESSASGGIYLQHISGKISIGLAPRLLRRYTDLQFES